MAYNNIKFVNEDGIGILTISRPKALNALNTETVTELNDCVGKIEADESVKVVIITGEGAKSFVAGADIVEMSTKNPVEGRKFGKISQDTFTRIENLPQPVIAAVNGYALGGGCELACACDFRYAAENAKFGQPEVGHGVRSLVVEQVDGDAALSGAHDDGSHGPKCLMGLRPAGNPNPVMLRGAGRGTRAGRDPERHETGQGTFSCT